MTAPVPSRRAALLPVSVLLADVTCFGIVMPLLASYAAEYRASTTAIGLLVAIYSLLHFLLAPLWGRLSDRIGRRPVLLIGLFGTLASSVIFALADSFLLLAVSRIVAGSLGATLNITQAYAADVTTPERRTRVMGFIGAAFGVGFIFGPTIGGITSAIGPAAPGLAASAIAFVNLLVAMTRLPEGPAPSERFAAAPPTPAAASRFRVPFVAAFLSTLAFTVIYVVFPLHAEQALGFDRSRVSYLFAMVGVMTALVQGGLIGRLSRRYGEGRLVMTGGLLMAAGLVALAATADGAWALYPGLIALGVGFGMAGPAEAGYVSRLAPRESQGRVLGMLQSANSVARVLGPVAAGLAMAAGGAVSAFLTAAAAAAGAGALGTRMRGSEPPKAET